MNLHLVSSYLDCKGIAQKDKKPYQGVMVAVIAIIFKHEQTPDFHTMAVKTICEQWFSKGGNDTEPSDHPNSGGPISFMNTHFTE